MRPSKLKIALVLIFTLVFLVIVLSDIELEKAKASIQNAQWLYFLPMFLCYLASHLLRSFRLWLLLERQSSYLRILSINTVGFLAINVMPLRLGEMVRPYLLLEKESIDLPHGLAAIFIERLLDFLMLLGLLLGVAFWVELPSSGIRIQGIDVIASGQKAVGFISVMGFLGCVVLVLCGNWIIPYIEKLPKGMKLAGFVDRFRLALTRLFGQPLHFLKLLVLSMVIWLITVVAVSMAMAAFDGIPNGFSAAWATWTIILSGMTAVPTPGFFGIYELSCVAALELWNVDPTLSRTFAVALHLGQLGFIAVLGAFFILREGIQLSDLSRPSE